MPGEQSQKLTGGLALYVLERLIADRQIAQSEVSRYLAELPREIQKLEARIQALRGDEAAAKPEPIRATRKAHTQRRRGRPAARNGKALGGMYGGLFRRVPAAEQPHFEEIKARDGIAAAIAALRERKR
jgi:outer membrane murein-binding lipoprotein Lpp